MAYKSALPKKQIMSSTQVTKPMRADIPSQPNKSTSVLLSRFSKRATGLTNRSMPSTSSSKSFFVKRMVPRDLEISSTFESPEWTGKTLSEKNQWITKFLNRTKEDISFVLKHVTDLIVDGDSTMKDETYELLSMSGVNQRVSATDDCLRAIRLKLLEDKCARFNSELISRDQTIKDLSEQLNKDTRSQESQTSGIDIDELTKSLSDVSSQNTVLRLELNSSNQLKEILQRDTSAKIDELNIVSKENSSLNSKLQGLNSEIQNLNKTFVEMKAQSSKQITRIESLRMENIKFKQDFFEAQKQRDDYYESWMEVKNKYEKTNEKLIKLQSERDEIRKEEIHRSLIESDLMDKTQKLKKEIVEKEQKMANLRSTVGQLEKSVEKYKIVDQQQSTTINKLKANVKEMETRAQCWINRNVRDNYESKISNLEQLLERLEIDKKQLALEYQKTVARNSELAVKNDKYIEKLQSHMDGQQKLINLMRKVKFNPAKFEQSSIMDSIFLKFEDEQKMRQDLENLIKENYTLHKRNMEYKKVLDSHPFKQLFVTF